jgi:hypothetical protein
MDTNALGDHLAGVELQLVELVEQQKRAEAQGDAAEAGSLQGEIDALHAELAAGAEALGLS